MRARHLRRTLLTWLSLGLYGFLRRRRLRRTAYLQARRRQWRHTRTKLGGRTPVGASGAPSAVRTAAAVTTGALAAGGAMAFSEPAYAISVGDIANQVSHKTMKELKRILRPVLKVIEEFTGQQDDKLMGAIGASTDSINTQAVEIHNKRVDAAAEARPDPCGSDALAQDTQSSGANAAVDTARTDLQMTAQLSTRSATQQSNALYTRVAWHHAHFGPDSEDPFADRSVAWISKTQFSQTDQRAGLGYADSFIGQSRDAAGALPPDAQNTEAAAPYQDLSATFAARRSACMRPVFSALSKRTAAPGHSSLRENQTAEVARTYGGTHWRNRMDEYDDPTPVCKEIAMLLSFQNHLALEQLKTLEETNITLGAIGLQLMEAPHNLHRLDQAYEVAAGSPRYTPLKTRT